jgi:hypothetical protein
MTLKCTCLKKTERQRRGGGGQTVTALPPRPRPPTPFSLPSSLHSFSSVHTTTLLEMQIRFFALRILCAPTPLSPFLSRPCLSEVIHSPFFFSSSLISSCHPLLLLLPSSLHAAAAFSLSRPASSIPPPLKPGPILLLLLSQSACYHSLLLPCVRSLKDEGASWRKIVPLPNLDTAFYAKRGSSSRQL